MAESVSFRDDYDAMMTMMMTSCRGRAATAVAAAVMIVEPEGVKKMKKLKLAIIFAEIIIVKKDAKLFSFIQRRQRTFFFFTI